MELSAEDLALVGRICDEIQLDEELGGVHASDAALVDAERAADELRREKNRLKVRRHYHRRLVRLGRDGSHVYRTRPDDPLVARRS